VEGAREGRYLSGSYTNLGAYRPMRATSLLKTVFGIKFTRVTGISFSNEGLICDVAPTTTIPRCGNCCCRVNDIYDHRERWWRHLDLGGMKTELRYSIRRVECPRCGVTTELVPWAAHGSHFTDAFEQTTAFLAQACAQTVVAEAMRVAWRTVGAIIRRVVDRVAPTDRLAGLTHIGVDELSYRKHHEYVTIIVDHVSGNVVWAHPGKNADTLRKFFVELGPERCALLKAVTIDMSGAYRAAAEEHAINADIIFDRFHVQRLAHDALDEVRRAEVRATEEPEDRRALKYSRFALQKNPWNLTTIEEGKLVEVQRTNRTLYRAYLLKESLAAILDRRQPYVAEKKLGEWISWATHSGIQPFAKAARTIANHLDGIVAYVASGLSNGRSEGLNGKARTITRRSYGFHDPWSLIGMLFLCCSGITLHPARTLPCTH
jgi:transposase